ncbi:VOC family protein [Pseudonocardia sp. CA-107938]|uniref:VOC family protein n=1 Tax=Pseudonocardia sp. CA-107938 TaxID=3240021 RepID=UPI003D8E0C2D
MAALARYKDLCIDAGDAPRTARFWAAALGLDLAGDKGGPWLLTGPTPQHAVWVNPVPDPHTVKRMHLDVHCASIDELVALGATVVRELPRWTIMADPEGGEFCAFVRAEPPQQRLYELVLDSTDPVPLGRWWAEVLGAGEVEEDADSVGLGKVPGAPFEYLVVGAVPEPKTIKNRVHIDVVVEPDGGLAALVERGATVLRERTHDTPWTTLADPQGNEFDAFEIAAG